MGWSGGSYTRVGGSTAWADDRDAGTEIEAGLHDTHDEDLADGINACLAKDGSNAATGNLDIGANKLTNVANPTSAQDAATKDYVDSGRVFDYEAVASTGISTAEVVESSLTVTIPATWNTYDLIAQGAGYIDDLGAANDVVCTLRVRDGTTTAGTLRQGITVTMGIAQPDNHVPISVYAAKVGETTTGAVSMCVSAQVDASNQAWGLASFNWSLTAWRTS